MYKILQQPGRLLSLLPHNHWGNIWRFAMRVSFFYIFILLSTMQVLLAHSGNSQGLDEIMVTVGMKNEKLEALFNKVEKQTGLKFVFYFAQVESFGEINLPEQKRSVKETLDLALEGTPLNYKRSNGSIIIYEDKKDNAGEREEVNPILRDEIVLITVSGKVTDVNGNAMAGVNIIEKGTANGTTSDATGYYVIDVQDGATLVFSFIGYKVQEVLVDSRTTIDITLEEDVATLQEVTVNAGYWQVNKRERTGSISQVTADDIQGQPVLNPLAAIQGRVTGVYIQQSTGVPGGGFNVRVRGRNSIANGNDPLYIIDGVPFSSTSLYSVHAAGSIVPHANPLSNISPSDIESIEILKDADATAIYGSRGANGVVLITTKKGIIGKTKIDVSLSQGVGKITRKIDLLNTAQYLEMRNEAFDNDDATPGVKDYDINGTWDQGRYTDWQEELIGGTARTTDAQISLSGGSEITQILIGGEYYKETTVFPGDAAYRRGSSSISVSQSSANQKLKAVVSVNYRGEKSTLPNIDFTNFITLPPNAPALYDEIGNLNWENGTFDNNPIQFLKRKYEANTVNMMGSASISYDLLSELQIKTNLGYIQMQRDEIQITPQSSFNPAWGYTSSNTSTYFADNNNKTWIMEPQAIWTRKLGGGQLNMQIGSTFQQNVVQGKTLAAKGFNSDALIENIDAASTVTVSAFSYLKYKYTAIFGRVNYDWKEKYILNLTARRDGSSRFGPNNRFADFGAIGMAWIFSNEDYIQKSISFLSFGKLRTSFGTTGNDQIGDYEYLELWKSEKPYQGSSTLSPSRISNPGYAWELNKKIEVALELGLAKDRILASIGHYRNRSSNQLVRVALPPSTGFTSVRDNLSATVENNGWEIELNTTNIKKNDLVWNTSINLTIPRNKLISFPDLDNSSYANIYEIGQPLSIQKVFNFMGVNPQTGSYTFEDVNEDGVLSYPNDLYGIKKIGQKYYGGIQNTLRFRRWQLDFLIQFVKQTGNNYITNFLPPGWMTNQPSVVLGRWQEEGDVTNVQRFSQNFSEPVLAYFYGRLYGGLSVSDASFIRLKNISLTYQLPIDLINKLHMHQAKFYVQGQNLFTITDFLGMDPESQNILGLPPLRRLIVGFNVTF